MDISLMKKWKFSLGVNEGAEQPSFDDSSWRNIDLPHDWQIENNRDPAIHRGGSQGFYPREQIGWYRYRFNAPLEWKDKWACLRFDGVQRFSTIYLNGVEAGGRPYGYVPFDVDLNSVLKYGEENVLAVKVDNTKGGGDRWYSGAGIYRQVFLSISDNLFIPRDGVAITTLNLGENSARIRLSVEVTDRSGKAAHNEIQGTIIPPGIDGVAGKTNFSLSFDCAAGSTVIAEKEIEIKNPIRWDPDNPALYGLSLTLGSDVLSLRFGLREAHFDGDEGFFLNGRSLKLRGVNLHHDGGAVGAAVPLAIWRRRFAALKNCGVNAIRCSHNPQAAEFYDLADEMGFLLIDEIYDKWAPSELYYREFFDEWWERDVEAWIRRDRNHPSIILWSTGNEIEFQFHEHFFELLSLMRSKIIGIDPTRPVSAALIPPVAEGYNDSTPLETKIGYMLRYAEYADVFMGNYMESFYRPLREAGMKKAIIGSEVFTCYRMVEEQTTNKLNKSPWLDVMENNFVAGSFLWAGIDYLGESPLWPSRGWAGAALDTACFEKIRSWYLSSFWKDEPVLRLAVFDESEPYDMATNFWSFPQMRRRWNYPQPSQVKHVAAITNCDTVRLYLNEEDVREAAPDKTGDGMAHFWVSAAPGTLRAEGWRKGVKVIEDMLRTAKQAAIVEIIAPPSASLEETVPVEIWLKDKYGEPWVQDNPLARVRLKGCAEIIALDNGDMCSAEPYVGSERTFWNGHILAVLRMGESKGTVRITVETEGMNPAIRDISVE